MRRRVAGRRIRVGIDFHVWDGIYQGSRSYLVGLYRAAIILGKDIDFFFFLDDTASLKREFPEFGLPNVTLVRMKTRSGVSRLGFQLSYLRIRYRLDLLHVQYRLPFFFGGACICTIHDILFETNPEYFKRSFVIQSRLTSKRAARKAACLFATSEYTRNQIVDLYGISPAKVTTIYSGADFERFFPAPGGEDLIAKIGLKSKSYIVSVGRLEPRKNQAALLEAYIKLGPDAPTLVLIGQRDYGYSDVMDRLADPALKGRVLLFEDMNDEVMTAVLRHAQIFVYPSFAEGFGMPVLEAMASGVPVITSSRTSLPEVAGGAAVLIDPGSRDAISNAILALLEDEKLRTELSKKGIERARFFSWTRSAEKMLQAIRKFAAA